MPEAKEMKIPNLNNCLACDAFIQINIAPASLIPESSMNKLYYVNHEGQDIYMRLIDILRIDFAEISSLMTLPATGMESHEWRDDWLAKYPDTKADTKMCIYYYKKHK